MNRYYLAILLAALAFTSCIKDGDTTVINNGDYVALDQKPCGQVLTGTLAGITLAPGVYCFDAEAELTGLLTLDGPSSGSWVFKVGTTGTGALAMTSFDIKMAGAGNPCKVTWRATDGITSTDSNIVGSYLAGKDVTLTRGSLTGRVWSQTGVVTITETIVTNCDLTPAP